MLTREDYLDIKQELVKELFTYDLTEERIEVIKETLDAIAKYTEEEQ